MGKAVPEEVRNLHTWLREGGSPGSPQPLSSTPLVMTDICPIGTYVVSASVTCVCGVVTVLSLRVWT